MYNRMLSLDLFLPGTKMRNTFDWYKANVIGKFREYFLVLHCRNYWLMEEAKVVEKLREFSIIYMAKYLQKGEIKYVVIL